MPKINDTLLNKRPQVFILCYEMRNFSAVARVLNVTQSSVSKDIRALENELGFELFTRHSRPLMPTPEARILHKFLQKTAGEFAQVHDQLRNSNAIKPVLRVGILESLSLNMGVEIVRQMFSRLSQITLITASANVLLQRLSERKLDLVITNNLANTTASYLFAQKIFEEPSILMLPKSLSKKYGADYIWTWNELAVCGLPLIRYWKESGAGELNDIFLLSHGMQFSERIQVDTNALMVRLVEEGIGWAFSRPTTVLQNIHLLKNIAVVPMQPPTLTRTVFVLGREGEFESEATVLANIGRRVFSEKIIPEVLKFAPWLSGQIRAVC